MVLKEPLLYSLILYLSRYIIRHKSTYSKELIELLFVESYTEIEVPVRNGIAERRTVSKYRKQLQDMGNPKLYLAWKETIYINTRLMELIKLSD